MSSLVDSVQFFEHTFPSANTQTYLTLASGTDISHCVPFVSWYGNTDYPRAQFFDVWFEDTGNDPRIYFQRTETRSTSLYLKVNVVEFDDTKVKVYQGELPTRIANSPETTTTVSGGPFDRNRSALRFYHRAAATDDHINHHLCRGVLTTYSGSYGEDISFKRVQDTGTDMFGHYYIFESIDDDFTVKHYSGSLTGGIAVDTGFYDWHNSFLLTSYCGDDSSSGDVDQSSIRSYLYGNHQIHINKTDASNTVWYGTQLLTFDNDATASGTRYCPKITSYHSMSTSYTERELSMTDHVSDKATMIVVQNPTRCDADVLSEQSDAFHAVWLTASGTKYKIQRASKTTNAYPSYYVVDWGGNQTPNYSSTGTNPAPIASGISPVKSVENFAFTGPDLHVNKMTLSKGQDVSNCVVFKTGHANNTSSWNQQHRHQSMAYFRGNELYLERGNEGWTYETGLSVVEFYPDQVKVQQGDFYIDTNATSTTVTIEEVDTSKTFMLFGHFWQTSTDEWGYQLVRGRVTDSTTLTFSRSFSHSYPILGTWFVAEDLGENWHVRHWNSGTVSSNRVTPQWTTHYSPHNTFNLMSSESPSNTDDPDDCTWHAYYHSPMSPARGEKHTSGSNSSVNFQVIRFLDETRARVYYTNRYLTGTSTSTTYDLPDEFATSSGITPVWNNLNGNSRVNTSSTNGITHAFHYVEHLPDTNQITMTRRYSGTTGDSGGSLYVVDWAGYNKSSGDYEYKTLGNFVKSIEKVTYTGSSRRITWTLSKNQDVSNCVPFGTWLQGEDTGTDPERFLWAFWVYPEISSFMASNYWGANNPGVEFAMSLVEFDPAQVRVQFIKTQVSNGSTTQVVTIDEVDTTKTFLQIYCFPGDWADDDWGNVAVAGRLTSSTEITFERNMTTSHVDVTCFVIECLQDQWEVQHETSTTSNTTTYSHYFDPRPKDKTFSVASYSTNQTNMYPSYFFRMYPLFDQRGTYGVRLNRQSSGYNLYRLNTSMISFNENTGVIVVPIHYYFGTTEGSKTYSIGRSVDPNRTVVFNGIGHNTMRVNTTSTTGVQCMFTKATIQDSETLLVERDTSYSCEAWGHVYVIEFPFDTHKVTGVVREKGNFVSRNLNLHNTTTGELLDTTTSSGVDGSYELLTSYSGSTYVVCFDDPEGTVYNGLIETDVYPTAISGTFPHEEGWL